MATIYISSDPREFKTYRDVLRERLRDHGHKVLTREELAADSKATLLQRIEEALLKCDAVLCLMGERYGAEPPEKEREARGGERRSYTQWEYLLAGRSGKPVHVFYAEDEAPLDAPNDEGKDVTKLQETFLAEEVVSKGVVCKGFQDQAHLVGQVLQLQPAWPQDQEVTRQNPYVGLRRFEEKDKDRFFGRVSLVQQVLEEVETHRLTALVGQSGAGKSSLVRAAVIPAWRKQHPDGKVIVFQPDQDPFLSLANALHLAGFDATRVRLAGEPSECVFRDLRRGSSRASDPLGTKGKPATEPWLIFVDQLEEICTRPGPSLDDQECIRRFVVSLEDAIRLESEGITLLLALRDDFFGCLRAHPGLCSSIDKRLIRVITPNAQELRTLVEAPAKANGMRLEEGLVPALLTDLEECGGGLPILGDALAQLWEAEAEAGLADGLLKMETYRKIGGVARALPGRMNRYLQAKGTEEQRTVQNLLLALIGILNIEGTLHRFSRPLPQSELLEKGGRNSQEILRELISPAKVLVAAEEANAFDPKVELAHEALIRGWDQLDRWLAASREALDLREEMSHCARSWDHLRSGGKANVRAAKALLWKGGRLARALDCNRVEPFAKQSEFDRIGGLDLQEQDFLKASHQAETLFRKLMQRLTVAACAAILAGTGTWIVLARQSLAAREQARNTDLETRLATAQSEAAQGWLARAHLSGPSTDAAFYAARALGFAGAGKPENSETGGPLAPLLPGPGSGNPKTAEALRIIGQVPLPFVWSSPSPAEPAAGEKDGAGAAVAWSPSGKWFASGGPGSTVVLWGAQQGEPARKLEGHEGPVTCLAFSPDGTLLATGGADKKVRLWAVPGGEPVATLVGHSGWVSAVAFRHDGSQLASGGYDEKVRLWDLKEKKEVRVLSGDLGFVYSVAFHPDGTLLAAGGEHDSVYLWETESGKARPPLKGHAMSVNGVAFSPDGKLLATCSSDQTVKLWELSGGKETATLTGHGGGAASLAWSAGGDRLASAGKDRKIRIWIVKERRQECTLTGHAADVTSLAWDPANTHLLSASRAGDVKLWMVPLPSPAPDKDQPETPVPPRNLFRYVDGGWAGFDADTGEVTWKQPATQLGYREEWIRPDSWIGILRSSGDESQQTQRLFRAALAARDWNAARLLAGNLPAGQKQEAGDLTTAAARALVAETQSAATPGMVRLRMEQGRALVAWHETWKQFDTDPAAPVDAMVAKLFPPKEESTAVPGNLAAATPVPAPAPGADGTAPGTPTAGADGTLRAQVIGQPGTPMPGTQTPPAGVTPPAEPLIHVVQAGDNPFTIAKKYGITQDELMEFNKIKDPRRLQIGTELKIPPGGDTTPEPEAPQPAPEPEDPNFRYHSVRPGENPSIVARKYRVLERDLMKLNNIDDPSKLQIGQRLKIPNTSKSKGGG